MRCRHCDSQLTRVLVDLGACPPSNAFLKALTDPEEHYPLRVLVCDACLLVQTDISLFKLDHDALFTKDYPYFSSMSGEFVRHAREFVEMATERFALGPDSMMVEVGSNDGYLLQWAKTPCYGIEPTNTGEKAARKGIRSYYNFFGSGLARSLVQWGGADLMIANNVLAHVPDINDFVRGFAVLLKDTGAASFEFPHLLRLIEGAQFDTIYHEHYSYLSLTAVQIIFASQGLSVFDVEELPTHGGSLRVWADKGARAVEPSVAAMILRERSIDYAGFQAKADRVKNDFTAFLLGAKERGKTVAAFGAAAKGNTLLNYAGIRSDLIAYVVDETPAKNGKFLPGSRIPVRSEFDGTPDYVVILPWNHKEEIIAKLRHMRTTFVTAIPHLRQEGFAQLRAVA